MKKIRLVLVLTVALSPRRFRLARSSRWRSPARTGLADALRNELLLYGISVHLFLPATIFTPGFEQEMKTKPQLCKTIEGPDEGMGPDQVAAHMIKGKHSFRPRGAAQDDVHIARHADLGLVFFVGLERNHFYITYEPVGHMLRNSRGIVPRNNILLDTFWGIAGTVSVSCALRLASSCRSC